MPVIERLARVVLGAVLAIYAWIGSPQPNLVFVATGLCIALTGLIGFCPACALFGRRLRPRP